MTSPPKNLAADRLVDRVAVPHDVVIRNHEAFQRRVYIVKVDVGDKTINRSVYASSRFTVHKAVLRNQGRDRGEVGQTTRHRGIGIEAADALVVIALGVELLGLRKTLGRDTRMLAQQRIAKEAPVRSSCQRE